MLCLSTDRLVVSFFPDAQFSVNEFERLGNRPQQPEALYSALRTELGIWTREPWSHVWHDDIG